MTLICARSPVADPRVRQYVFPTRIVWSEQVPGDLSLLTRPCVIRPCYPPPPVCILPPGSAVLVDFGEETVGHLRLVTGMAESHQPAQLRIRLGESASEAMASPDNDHALHDFSLQAPWCGEVEVGPTAFRFARIDVAAGSGPLHLAQVCAVSLLHPAPVAGSFHCSDDRLNAIWAAGARTIQLCMQDVIVDGPKRDRLAWMGDTVVEARIVRAVFGTDPLIARTLTHLRDVTPPSQNMNNMASYSWWWIVSVLDSYAWTGDIAWLREQQGYVQALLERFAAEIAAAPGWADRPASFVDHPTGKDPVSGIWGTRAIEIIGLSAGVRLCDVLALTATAQLCREALQALRANTLPVPILNKAATSLVVLAGLIDPGDANRQTLSVEPKERLSTFMGNFILDARTLAGDYAGCLDLIRIYWGGMLDLGAGTFWEDFDIQWLDNACRIDELPVAGKVDVHAERGEGCYAGHRHSFCHGWSAGPTAWLTRHVLGVEPVDGHSLRLTVRPNLVDLSFAEGTWPTPAGVVKIRHERGADGTISTTIAAPAGVTVG